MFRRICVLLFLLVFLLPPRTTAAGESGKQQVRRAMRNLPLSFERNRGQLPPSAEFRAQGGGFTLLLNRQGANLQMGHSATLQMKVAGARPGPEAEALDQLPGVSNYLIGNDSSRWRAGVAHYSRVRYREVYPGVDLLYYGNQHQLEYDFVVAPGANPRVIRLQFDGARQMVLERGGDLALRTAAGEIRFHRPIVYQVVKGERRPVEGRFVSLGRREVGFQVGPYDPALRLVIDPVLSYSSYLGCDQADDAIGIALDGSGNIYLAGITNSLLCPGNFPIPVIQQVYGGGTNDAVVMKLNSTGSALLYVTYLGGADADQAVSVAVDAQGNAVVVGGTRSANFPVVAAAQPVHGGGACGTPPVPCWDTFVAKLNPSGTALVYSTYLGGDSTDGGDFVAVDPSGNAYVAGMTTSANFPVRNAVQPTFQGVEDGTVSKLSPQGSLIYSTYLGGSAYELAMGIAVDSAGSAYVVGSTLSSNFPTAGRSPQMSVAGGQDSFITKLSADGQSYVYSTFQGGKQNDGAMAVALDSGGNAYVLGWTRSTDFPTVNPAQATHGGGSCTSGSSTVPCYDAYITKYNADGSEVVYSTFLGGSSTDNPYAIAVDASGNAHVAGYTTSTNFPIVNPVQSVSGGYIDVFVAKLNASGTAFLYSTYLGGMTGDYGYGIALTAAGDAWVTGTTYSFNFPFAGNPVQSGLFGGTKDGFLTQIRDVNPTPVLSLLSPTTARAGGAPLTLTVSGSSFTSTALVRWNGSDRPTTYVSNNSLKAVLSTKDLTAGTARVTVYNPAPGGGVSNGQNFLVTSDGNPAPVLTSMSPEGIFSGAAAFTLTVNGTGFISGSQVRFGGSTKTTTYISPTQLQAAITSADVAYTGTKAVTVVNQSPGGGTSNALTFMCPAASQACPYTTAEPKIKMTLPAGFYIAEGRNAAATREGYWGMEVLVSQGVLAGGFNLGGAAQENGGTPAFGAFSLPSTQTVRVRVDSQVLPGSTAPLSMSVRLLDSNRQQIGGEATGGSLIQFERSLAAGFYIIEIKTGSNGPRATFQMGLTAESFSGGVVVGGYVAPGLAGFGAFYVPEPQEVNIKILGPSYGSGGANCMRLLLMDADRNLLASTP